MRYLPEVRRVKGKQLLKLAAGVGLAVALLWVFFHRTSLAEVQESMGAASPLLLGAVLVLNIVSLVTRSWRWQILLRPLKADIRFGPSWRFYNVGFAVSALLPGRIGELLRPYLLARDQEIPFSSTFATIVTERIIDLTVVLTMLASGFIVPGVLGPHVAEGTNVAFITTVKSVGLALLAAVVVATAFLCALKWQTVKATSLARKILSPFPKRLSEKVGSIIEAFAEGIGGLRQGRQLIGLVGSTAISWAVLCLSYYSVLAAFGLVVPVQYIFFFVAVVALGVVVPTPGGAGAYHAAIILVAGDLWGFGETHGGAVAACAIMAHLLAMTPIVAFGAYYSLRQGIDVFRAVEEASESTP